MNYPKTEQEIEAVESEFLGGILAAVPKIGGAIFNKIRERRIANGKKILLPGIGQMPANYQPPTQQTSPQRYSPTTVNPTRDLNMNFGATTQAEEEKEKEEEEAKKKQKMMITIGIAVVVVALVVIVALKMRK